MLQYSRHDKSEIISSSKEEAKKAPTRASHIFGEPNFMAFRNAFHVSLEKRAKSLPNHCGGTRARAIYFASSRCYVNCCFEAFPFTFYTSRAGRQAGSLARLCQEIRLENEIAAAAPMSFRLAQKHVIFALPLPTRRKSSIAAETVSCRNAEKKSSLRWDFSWN